MTAPAAFQATVHSFRTVPSRGVLQVVIEAPIEQHSMIAGIAVHGAWIAVARIEKPNEVHPQAAKLKSYASEAGAMCASAEFWKFLFKNQYGGEQEATFFVRAHCGVKSRSEIIEGSEAAAKWSDLMARFEIWRRA